MDRKIQIVKTTENKNMVIIHDIRFKGRRNIDWEAVEEYLKEYVGNYYEIAESSEKIYIGSDFPDEYSWSNDTKKLKGLLAKAKANAAQGLPELIEVATNKRFQENMKEKHSLDAKNGWYRYTSLFALAAYGEDEEVVRYNVFRVEMLIRHAENGKMYLYDLVNIKKKK